MVKLLFYKGSAPGATLWDKIICWITNSKYSHVEMSFENRENLHRCWSSSTRDGGVRPMWIQANPDSWEAFSISVECNEDWFIAHEGFKYDYIGLLGTLTGKEWFSNKYKYFCSECIAEVMGIKDSWKYSPEDLYQLVK